MIMMMMINVTSAVFHLNPEGVSGLSIQLCYSIFRLFESICMDIRGGRGEVHYLNAEYITPRRKKLLIYSLELLS